MTPAEARKIIDEVCCTCRSCGELIRDADSTEVANLIAAASTAELSDLELANNRLNGECGHLQADIAELEQRHAAAIEALRQLVDAITSDGWHRSTTEEARAVLEADAKPTEAT